MPAAAATGKHQWRWWARDSSPRERTRRLLLLLPPVVDDSSLGRLPALPRNHQRCRLRLRPRRQRGAAHQQQRGGQQEQRAAKDGERRVGRGGSHRRHVHVCRLQQLPRRSWLLGAAQAAALPWRRRRQRHRQQRVHQRRAAAAAAGGAALLQRRSHHGLPCVQGRCRRIGIAAKGGRCGGGRLELGWLAGANGGRQGYRLWSSWESRQGRRMRRGRGGRGALQAGLPACWKQRALGDRRSLATCSIGRAGHQQMRQEGVCCAA